MNRALAAEVNFESVSSAFAYTAELTEEHEKEENPKKAHSRECQKTHRSNSTEEINSP